LSGLNGLSNGRADDEATKQAALKAAREGGFRGA